MHEKRLQQIRNRLNHATPGTWVYSKERDTHDYCIHVKGAVERNGQIHHDTGGVIGSSEWIWVEDKDAEFIAHAKEDIAFLLNRVAELETREQYND